jgi:polar amino acid transport system substrate-binding protein
MMDTRLRSLVPALALAVALVAGACSSGGGGSTGGGSPTPAADPNTDKLAQILARGTLVLFTDPEYPPQSFAVEGAERSADTKCRPTELTAEEIGGYDAETGKLVAQALGVEPCFVTPTWTEVTAGNWGDRWDLAYGSGAIATDRMEVLYMTQPYYATPNNFFLPAGSDVEEIADLSGMRVGACTGCTMEDYLRGTLELPGPPIEFLVKDPTIVTFDTEVPGLKATARGDLDAFLCSEPVGAEAIAEGLELEMLPTPAYVSYKTGYVDRSSGLAAGPFVERVNQIVAGLHADGTLAALSTQYFGTDYATLAAGFDLGTIGQTVT